MGSLSFSYALTIIFFAVSSLSNFAYSSNLFFETRFESLYEALRSKFGAMAAKEITFAVQKYTSEEDEEGKMNISHGIMQSLLDVLYPGTVHPGMVPSQNALTSSGKRALQTRLPIFVDDFVAALKRGDNDGAIVSARTFLETFKPVAKLEAAEMQRNWNGPLFHHEYVAWRNAFYERLRAHFLSERGISDSPLETLNKMVAIQDSPGGGVTCFASKRGWLR